MLVYFNSILDNEHCENIQMLISESVDKFPLIKESFIKQILNLKEYRD